MRSPLPDSWIDQLFARMSVRYGSAWTRMWEGIDSVAVKADWAEELGGFRDMPDAIKYGLANLPPDRPPTVTQFSSACNRAPVQAAPALAAPKAAPEVVAKALASIGITSTDPLDWARRLRDRDVNHGGLLTNGRHMTKFQREAWRAALGETRHGVLERAQIDAAGSTP